MIVPDEFSGRVCKTKIGFLDTNSKKLTQIQKEFSNSEIDVIIENLQPIVVLVFESQEDCLMYKLKYGENYV